jgi:hypothetical protein
MDTVDLFSRRDEKDERLRHWSREIGSGAHFELLHRINQQYPYRFVRTQEITGSGVL